MLVTFAYVSDLGKSQKAPDHGVIVVLGRISSIGLERHSDRTGQDKVSEQDKKNKIGILYLRESRLLSKLFDQSE